MTKDRNKSEEKERITMEGEHLVPTSMFKGEQVNDEVMTQDEGVDMYSVAEEMSLVSDAVGVLTIAMETTCVQEGSDKVVVMKEIK